MSEVWRSWKCQSGQTAGGLKDGSCTVQYKVLVARRYFWSAVVRQVLNCLELSIELRRRWGGQLWGDPEAERIGETNLPVISSLWVEGWRQESIMHAAVTQRLSSRPSPQFAYPSIFLVALTPPKGIPVRNHGLILWQFSSNPNLKKWHRIYKTAQNLHNSHSATANCHIQSQLWLRAPYSFLGAN